MDLLVGFVWPFVVSTLAAFFIYVVYYAATGGAGSFYWNPDQVIPYVPEGFGAGPSSRSQTGNPSDGRRGEGGNEGRGAREAPDRAGRRDEPDRIVYEPCRDPDRARSGQRQEGGRDGGELPLQELLPAPAPVVDPPGRGPHVDGPGPSPSGHGEADVADSQAADDGRLEERRQEGAGQEGGGEQPGEKSRQQAEKLLEAEHPQRRSACGQEEGCGERAAQRGGGLLQPGRDVLRGREKGSCEGAVPAALVRWSRAPIRKRAIALEFLISAAMSGAYLAWWLPFGLAIQGEPLLGKFWAAFAGACAAHAAGAAGGFLWAPAAAFVARRRPAWKVTRWPGPGGGYWAVPDGFFCRAGWAATVWLSLAGVAAAYGWFLAAIFGSRGWALFPLFAVLPCRVHLSVKAHPWDEHDWSWLFLLVPRWSFVWQDGGRSVWYCAGNISLAKEGCR